MISWYASTPLLRRATVIWVARPISLAAIVYSLGSASRPVTALTARSSTFDCICCSSSIRPTAAVPRPPAPLLAPVAPTPARAPANSAPAAAVAAGSGAAEGSAADSGLIGDTAAVPATPATGWMLMSFARR